MGISWRKEKTAAMEKDKKLGRRILMSVLGVLVCGMSVGLFKRAMLGVDPYQSLMAGLNAVIPISFGTLYVIMTGILLIFALMGIFYGAALLIGRAFPGAGIHWLQIGINTLLILGYCACCLILLRPRYRAIK